MRLKASHPDRPPEVNLVPMLDVMMAVLTFFVMITISLSLEKSVAFRLPADRYPEKTEPSPLVLDLTENGIRMDEQPLTQGEALAQTQQYLQTNPQGFILLRPVSEVTYQQMMEALLPIQALGGDRVSLVIREEPENAP